MTELVNTELVTFECTTADTPRPGDPATRSAADAGAGVRPEADAEIVTFECTPAPPTPPEQQPGSASR